MTYERNVADPARGDVRTVSGRLGHSQTSTTLNIYAEFLQSADKAVSESIVDALLRNKEGTDFWLLFLQIKTKNYRWSLWNEKKKRIKPIVLHDFLKI